MKKLDLDEKKIEKARELAEKIVSPVQDFISSHTTVSVERSVLRLLGVDGVNRDEIPMPNIIIDNIRNAGKLSKGAAWWLGKALLSLDCTLPDIYDKLEDKKFDIAKVNGASDEEVREFLDKQVGDILNEIAGKREKRKSIKEKLGEGKEPLLYVIVATGNIYEDVVQAQAAALQGADIIAVIRSTGQSLLDYVPYGATTEGYGGTYATQENFRIMRQALDRIGNEVGRYIRLVNYSSGLCMPEIAVIGAMEELDMLLNDAMYGILFRDINMKRTFIDQYFSRRIIAYAGLIINTGEDNYLTTSDAVEEAHTVLASQFINEQFALRAGLKPSQMGLGHAFEMDPLIENGFLMELAQAQMAREIFPEAPLKYMPPTKHKTGNIFFSHLLDGMFNLASVMSNQSIHLLGMMTEAIHTPFLQDRFLSIENAKYIMNNTRNLSDDVIFVKGGYIQARAQKVLDEAVRMLEEVDKTGLMKAIENKMFASVSRFPEGGKGLEGVVAKAKDYYNPFEQKLEDI